MISYHYGNEVIIQTSLRVLTKVLAGNRIEVRAPELTEGQDVEVTVTPASKPPQRPRAIDILDSLPGGQLFKTPEAADEYLKKERDSWDR